MLEVTKEGMEFYNRVFPGVENKDHLFDQLTPLYKSVMDNLSPRSQHIIYILAERASGMSAGEIARKIRVESKNTSVALAQLFDKGLIQKRKVNEKNYEYFLECQTFLGWAAMRWNLKRNVK